MCTWSGSGRWDPALYPTAGWWSCLWKLSPSGPLGHPSLDEIQRDPSLHKSKTVQLISRYWYKYTWWNQSIDYSKKRKKDGLLRRYRWSFTTIAFFFFYKSYFFGTSRRPGCVFSHPFWRSWWQECSGWRRAQQISQCHTPCQATDLQQSEWEQRNKVSIADSLNTLRNSVLLNSCVGLHQFLSQKLKNTKQRQMSMPFVWVWQAPSFGCHGVTVQ